MKKTLIIFLLTISLLSGVCYGACVDPDGQWGFLTATTVTNNGVSYPDACSILKPNYVLERYCISGSVGTRQSDCAFYGSGYICDNGACVFRPPIIDEDTCTDSDGLDYKNAGYVDANDKRLYDECSTLQPNHVSERYCSGTTAGTTNYDCGNLGSYICDNGACVIDSTPPDTCDDTDGGVLNQKNIPGTVSGVFNGQSYSNADYCSGNNLVEYYCDHYNHQGSTLYECYCKSGACSGYCAAAGLSEGDNFDCLDNKIRRNRHCDESAQTVTTTKSECNSCYTCNPSTAKCQFTGCSDPDPDPDDVDKDYTYIFVAILIIGLFILGRYLKLW